MADVVRHPRAPSVASTGRHCFARAGRRCRAVCEAPPFVCRPSTGCGSRRTVAWWACSHWEGSREHRGRPGSGKHPPTARLGPLSRPSVPACRQAWGTSGPIPSAVAAHRTTSPSTGSARTRRQSFLSSRVSCCLTMSWTSRWMWPGTRYASTRLQRRGPTTRLGTGLTGNAGSPRGVAPSRRPQTRRPPSRPAWRRMPARRGAPFRNCWMGGRTWTVRGLRRGRPSTLRGFAGFWPSGCGRLSGI